MDSKIAQQERIEFSERLHSALLAAGQPVAFSRFVQAYNLRADGAAVTVHAARKWLIGESIPTQEKILILARWLNVQPAWLRFGAPENSKYRFDAEPEQALSTEALILIRDIESLSSPAQVIVRDLVDSLMRNAAVGGGTASPRRTGRRNRRD